MGVMGENLASGSALAARSCALLGEGIVSPQSNTEETSVARRFLHLNVFEALGHQDTTSLAVKELPPTAMVDVNYASWVSWAMERRTEKNMRINCRVLGKYPQCT